MSLKEEIRGKIKKATLEKDVFTNGILKVILGEIELTETRKGSITEQESQKIVSKLIESNKETMEVMDKSDSRYQKLVNEIALMETLIPKMLSQEEIVEAIKKNQELFDNISASNHAGKSIGMAMKYFKANNIPVNGKDVGKGVATIMLTQE